MKRQLGITMLWSAIAAVAITTDHAAAQYAVEVRSYDPGTTPSIDFESGLPYNLTSTALGEPSRFTPDSFFPSVVSPFSGPFKRNQLLSVGESGHVTLRLSHYALPQAGGKEVGVFAHASLIDVAFPTGQAGLPAVAFSVDDAFVEMSADGTNWVALDEFSFDIPTNGYSDVTDPFDDAPGSVLSDFQKPFAGSLGSFNGLPHFDGMGPDILELLAGSGGGTWLDIPVGLSQVGFIRFRVDDDGVADVRLNFELDGVSMARAAMGPRTVPEPASVTLMISALLVWAASMRPGGRGARSVPVRAMRKSPAT